MTRNKMVSKSVAMKHHEVVRKSASSVGKIARLVAANAKVKKTKRSAKKAKLDEDGNVKPARVPKVASREIDEAQRSTRLSLSRAPFRRLVKRLLGPVRMSKGTSQTFQEGIEDLMGRVAHVAHIMERQAGRTLMRGSTVEAAAEILGM